MNRQWVLLEETAYTHIEELTMGKYKLRVCKIDSPDAGPGAGSNDWSWTISTSNYYFGCNKTFRLIQACKDDCLGHLDFARRFFK